MILEALVNAVSLIRHRYHQCYLQLPQTPRLDYLPPIHYQGEEGCIGRMHRMDSRMHRMLTQDV